MEGREPRIVFGQEHHLYAATEDVVLGVAPILDLPHQREECLDVALPEKDPVDRPAVTVRRVIDLREARRQRGDTGTGGAPEPTEPPPPPPGP